MLRNTFGLRLATAVLLIASFIIGPVVDSATCAVESGDAHSFVQTEAEHANEGAADSDHGNGCCCHQHCHHTPAQVPRDSTAAATPRDPAGARPDGVALASYTPGGLIRPPKV
jgi:hypothetical protein